MAVQAQHLLSHAFLPHCDVHGFDALGVPGCGPAAVGIGDAVGFGGAARSELTCIGGGGGDAYGFAPRKRARAGAAGFEEAGLQGLVLPLPAATVAPAAPAAHVVDVFPSDVLGSRSVGCGGASTSGRAAPGGACPTQGLLSQLYHQGVEIDALVRLETERMRAGLQEARRRHARAVLAAAERAASGRLRAAEAELERAARRNAELEERVRQLSAEGQAWLGVARSHEAVAAGLRATLDQLLLQPAGAAAATDGDAEDARSCCFETRPSAAAVADDAASRAGSPSCKSCGAGEASVLLLPCRHLCLCRACEAAVDACPVCAATKNASLHVLLS